MLQNLKRAILGLGMAGLPLVAAAQDSKSSQSVTWVETRFHRVHLKNGSFIDGNLVKKDRKAVVLNMKSGEFAIRADMIARLEYVKLRSLSEPPKNIALGNEPELTVSPPAAVPEPGTKPAAVSADPVVRLADAPAALADAIKRETPERRRAKLRELMDAKGAGVVAALLERVPGDVRTDIVALLAERKAADALPILSQLLKSTDASVREHALKAIAQVGPEGATAPYESFLADRDPLVRSAALLLFQKLGDPGVFDRVAALLQDADGSVRGTAFQALQALASKYNLKAELSQALRDALENVPAETAGSLVEALGKMKDKDLAPELARLAGAADPMVRAHAIAGLVATDPVLAGPLILERFEVENEYSPRIQLADGCRKLRLKGAIPPLIGWLDDEDDNIKSAASRALREITGQNFGHDVERWQSWWEAAKPK